MTRTNNSKVIFMPVETSSMLSSVGAIKEVWSQAGDKSGEQENPQPPKQKKQPRKKKRIHRFTPQEQEQQAGARRVRLLLLLTAPAPDRNLWILLADVARSPYSASLCCLVHCDTR